MKAPADCYQNTVTAANQLIVERDGDLKHRTREIDFNVRYNKETGNIRLQIADFILWDSDEQREDCSVEAIVKHAKKELKILSESFKTWR